MPWSPATRHRSQLRTRLTGHAVHSSRIDQACQRGDDRARLIVWLEDVMNRNRAEARSSNPFEPPYTTLHCGCHGRRNGRQHCCIVGVVLSRTSAPSRPRTRWSIWRDTEPMSREVVGARDAGDRRRGRNRRRTGVPRAGSKTRAGRIGRAPDAKADGRQRQSCRVVRHRGGTVSAGRMVDRGLRARRYRAGSPAGRIY